MKTLFDNFFTLFEAGLDALDLLAEGKFQGAADHMKKVWGELNGATVKVGTQPFHDYFADTDEKKAGSGPAADLSQQNKGTDIEGDKSKARIVNTRIDKIEVNVKVADAAGQNLNDIGRHVANIIVGSVRDSEIILSAA